MQKERKLKKSGKYKVGNNAIIANIMQMCENLEYRLDVYREK